MSELYLQSTGWTRWLTKWMMLMASQRYYEGKIMTKDAARYADRERESGVTLAIKCSSSRYACTVAKLRC